MSGRARACICGAVEPCKSRCEKHDRDLHFYSCWECHEEWRQANPRTSAAIGRLASGKGSTQAVAAARVQDAAALAAPADTEGTG